MLILISIPNRFKDNLFYVRLELGSVDVPIITRGNGFFRDDIFLSLSFSMNIYNTINTVFDEALNIFLCGINGKDIRNIHHTDSTVLMSC